MVLQPAYFITHFWWICEPTRYNRLNKSAVKNLVTFILCNGLNLSVYQCKTRMWRWPIYTWGFGHRHPNCLLASVVTAIETGNETAFFLGISNHIETPVLDSLLMVSVFRFSTAPVLTAPWTLIACIRRSNAILVSPAPRVLSAVNDQSWNRTVPVW